MTLIIGIDVGGTNLRLGIVQYEVQCNEVGSQNEQPKLLDEMRFKADFSGLCLAHQHDPDHAWHKILSAIADAVNAVRAKYPSVAAVGIGDLSADLSALIALPVITENDALAAAYGEFVTATKPVNNMIYLGLGTGVGGGLILNRQPFQGQHGVAMEVGHIVVVPGGRLCGCGNHGCMEQYASASGVSITYLEASGEHCSAEEIAAFAKTGDQNAIAAYSLAGEMLAQALAHILKVIDVTDVVVGGGMSAGWQFMQQSFQQRLDQDLIPALRGKVNVHISDMDDQAGIIGAAMLARKKT